ncbi:MAG: putative ABC transporter permease [Alkaliphilus sp.]|nr:putative ABC transporter permease [Alkaliphilus sp.]
MEHSILAYLWFFIIYSFIGWCVEIAYHTKISGEFINRGFLNGPACPIYGFGMIMIIFFLGPLANNFILLFIGSFLLTSVLEFFTGFVLEKIFNEKWWNYSEEPYNIKGYVSLYFSTAWGLAGVFILNIIHPLINRLVSVLNNKIGNILLALLLTYLAADFIVTILGIKRISKRLRLLDEFEEKLRLYTEDIGRSIHRGMTAAIKTRSSIHHKLEDSKSEFEAALNKKKAEFFKLKAKYNHLLLKEKNFVHIRLEKAFPNIKDKISDWEDRLKSK